MDNGDNKLNDLSHPLAQVFDFLLFTFQHASLAKQVIGILLCS